MCIASQNNFDFFSSAVKGALEESVFFKTIIVKV